MRYQTLGGMGLLAPEICLGTMTLAAPAAASGAISGRSARPRPTALSCACSTPGVNFIDTADVYAQGLSEEITGQAMKNWGRKRTDIVLATKCNGATGQGPNDRGSSRCHIMDSVKASLLRFGTDHIDLYQIHSASDPYT